MIFWHVLLHYNITHSHILTFSLEGEITSSTHFNRVICNTNHLKNSVWVSFEVARKKKKKKTLQVSNLAHIAHTLLKTQEIYIWACHTKAEYHHQHLFFPLDTFPPFLSDKYFCMSSLKNTIKKIQATVDVSLPRTENMQCVKRKSRHTQQHTHANVLHIHSRENTSVCMPVI